MLIENGRMQASQEVVSCLMKEGKHIHYLNKVGNIGKKKYPETRHVQ